MRDVAGFLRSLDYASASFDLPDTNASPQTVRERREKLLTQFRRESTTAFLLAYWHSVKGPSGLAWAQRKSRFSI